MVVYIDCPEYVVSDKLDINKVAACLDKALVNNFAGKKIVLRAISSEDHKLSKKQLVELIENEGSDRYDGKRSGDRYENKEGKQIDLFGQTKMIESGRSLSKFILEGFHIWAPKALERPQKKVDLWLVYDRSKLQSVLHSYADQGVLKRDGYVFKDPTHKNRALIGILIIK